MEGKLVSIKLLADAKEEYLKLKEIVRLERENGVDNSLHQTLLRSIDSKIGRLKENFDCGTQIPKKLFPLKYLTEYQVTNLWKMDLSGFWRMIYTIKQPQRNQAEIGVLDIWLDVLDIIDHKKYDKIFGYRKK